MSLVKAYNTFDFIGELGIPKTDDKFHEVKDNGKGWIGHRINFGIKESKMNSQFVELYGGYREGEANKVFAFSKGTKDQKGSKLEIAWDDRIKESTLEMVAGFSKIVIDLETDFEKKQEYQKLAYEIRNAEYEGVSTDADREQLNQNKAKFKELATNRHEFISEYDAVIFLAENLKGLTEHKFRVRGSVRLNEWKGKFYRKFNPETIEIVPSDYDNQLKANLSIFFQDGALDDSDFKEDKKIYVDGFLSDYDRSSKADRLFPQSFVINAEKLDMENKQHTDILEFLKSQFKTKSKNLHYLAWDVNMYSGAEAVELSVEDLTDSQKRMVNIGLAKLEDFAPKGGAFGPNVDELRLVKPLMKGIFNEGAVDLELKDDEVADLVVQSTADVSLEDVVKKEESSPTDEPAEEPKDDINKTMDNLFG